MLFLYLNFLKLCNAPDPIFPEISDFQREKPANSHCHYDGKTDTDLKIRKCSGGNSQRTWVNGQMVNDDIGFINIVPWPQVTFVELSFLNVQNRFLK